MQSNLLSDQTEFFTQAFHQKVFRTLKIIEFASADEEADCVFEHAFHLKVFYTLEIIELASTDEEAGYVFEQVSFKFRLNTNALRMKYFSF